MHIILLVKDSSSHSKGWCISYCPGTSRASPDIGDRANPISSRLSPVQRSQMNLLALLKPHRLIMRCTRSLKAAFSSSPPPKYVMQARLIHATGYSYTKLITKFPWPTSPSWPSITIMCCASFTSRLQVHPPSLSPPPSPPPPPSSSSSSSSLRWLNYWLRSQVSKQTGNSHFFNSLSLKATLSVDK